MSDDWEAGDLALCVKREPWRNSVETRNGGPRSGQTFVVEEVYLAEDIDVLMLAFSEFPFEGFAARFFRKIRPLTDDDRNEFAAELERPELVEACKSILFTNVVGSHHGSASGGDFPPNAFAGAPSIDLHSHEDASA